MQPYDLRQVHISGSPQAMGLAYGEECRDLIHAFVDARLAAAKVNLFDGGVRDRDLDRFLAVSRDSMAMYGDWDPTGYAEHCGIAEGANVDPLELFAAGNLTDMRDILICTQANAPADSEGCTAALVPPPLSKTAGFLGMQTWDLNPSDVAFVVAVHRLPDDGPETWSVTCAGCLSLVGMNETGLSVGTTNIKTSDSRPGIGYLGLIHRALACEDHDSACDIIASAQRSGAHNYWVASAEAATLLRCSARHCFRLPCHESPVAQTNHCIGEELVALEVQPHHGSSLKRLERINAFLSESRHDEDDLLRYMADRSDGFESINRYHEDGEPTATNSCAIANPAARRFRACRGPADRGIWYELPFERPLATRDSA